MEGGAQVCIPICLTWHVHLINRFKILKESIRNYPRIQKLISFKHVQEKLKISHIKLFLGRLPSLIV